MVARVVEELLANFDQLAKLKDDQSYNLQVSLGQSEDIAYIDLRFSVFQGNQQVSGSGIERYIKLANQGDLDMQSFTSAIWQSYQQLVLDDLFTKFDLPNGGVVVSPSSTGVELNRQSKLAAGMNKNNIQSLMLQAFIPGQDHFAPTRMEMIPCSISTSPLMWKR